MHKIFIAAAGLCVTFAGINAQAGEAPQWYVGLKGGLTFMNNQDFDAGPGSAASESFRNGYDFGGSIGMHPVESWPVRLEAEVSFISNQGKSFALPSPTITSGLGNENAYAYMANVYYDLPTGTGFSPYVGVGVGMLHVSLSSGDVSDNHLAYQAMAGIGYTPSFLPQTQWTVGYRYLGANHVEFGDSTVNYNNQAVEFGAKYRF